MPSASWALQQSVFATLSADTQITALLGPSRIFDDVPQKAAFPYLTLGQSSVRDWSTATESGDEHLLTLHVWSRADGRRQTHEIMGAIKSALHNRVLSLNGHRMINLRHEFSDARRDPEGDIYHGIVRLRAVTEPVT